MNLPLAHKFCTFMLLSAMPALAEWGTEPLGKIQEPIHTGSAPIKRTLETHFRSAPSPVRADDIVLFDNKALQCCIITPASPSPVEAQAAAILAQTLEAMTGQSVAQLKEFSVTINESGTIADGHGNHWKTALWIGNTRRAAEANLSAATLKPEGFKRVVKPEGLFILGNDRTPGGKEVNGTLFGVQDLLERHLGVRWLWPSPLGKVIPTPGVRLTLPPLDEQDEPALPQRLIRNGALNDRAAIGLKWLQAKDADYASVLKANAEWLTFQKAGESTQLSYRHAFGDWYTRYGKEHPGWFALKGDGSRVQVSERPRLCKANPEVARAAAQQVLRQYKTNPDMESASISPNDGSGEDGFCLCEECRKLDPANGAKIRLFYTRQGKRELILYPSLSDRVATFYNRIAEEVAKTKPNAVLGAYAYSAYRDVPLGVTLHPSIIIGFVGLDYTNDTVRQSDRARWDGWSLAANAVFLRPNALHGGYGLPLLYTRKLTDDLRHCYQTGMYAADFDSLNGHWATQGLNLYVLAKLLWDPSLDPTTLVIDYCESAFGMGALKMAEYFDALEKASDEVAAKAAANAEEELRPEENDTRVVKKTALNQQDFERRYFEVFTPEKMQALRALLAEADMAAGEDATIRARIAFFRTGLDYSDRYRAVVGGGKEERRALLHWYRQTFRENPFAFNSVSRLFRTGASFRGLE